MCTEIHLDVVALMWILGGGCLGYLGVKALRQYQHKTNTNKKPTTVDK